jgi:hypothetical protein
MMAENSFALKAAAHQTYSRHQLVIKGRCQIQHSGGGEVQPDSGSSQERVEGL